MPVLLEDLQKSFEEGRMEDLKRDSALYIAENPQSSKGHLFLGKANLQLKNIPRAKLSFYDANDIDPKDVEPLFCLAQVALAEKNTLVAQTQYRAMLDIDPSSTIAHSAIADLLLADERYYEATETYKKVLTLGGGQASVLAKAAQAYQLMGSVDEGLALIEKYPLESFNEAVTLLHRNFLLLLKDEQKAQALTQLLHQNLPNHPQYILEYAELLKKSEDYPAIEQLYTQLLDLEIAQNHRKDAYLQRAIVRKNMDKLQAALEDYDALIKIQSSAFYLLERSDIKLSLKDKKGALIDLNAAVQLQPDFETLLKRGHLYLKAKVYDRAIKDFTEVLRMDKNNAEAYYGLGLSHHGNGEKSKAITILQKAEALGHQRASAVLMKNFPKQMSILLGKSKAKFLNEFELEIANNKASDILSASFNRLWVPNMEKFILAMGEDIYKFSKTMVKEVLDIAAKDLLIITPQGLLLIEGENEPIEAFYKIEMESPHAVVLELQPTNGGARTRMRLLMHDNALVMSYPLEDKELPARYFASISAIDVQAHQKERLLTKKVEGPYFDDIEAFIASC